MESRKNHTPERVVNLLRQIDLVVASGNASAPARQDAEIMKLDFSAALRARFLEQDAFGA